MFLYVWQGDCVLEQYGNGLVVCLAPSLLHAVAVLKKFFGNAYSIPYYHPKSVRWIGNWNKETTLPSGIKGWFKSGYVEHWECWGSA